MSRLAAMQQEYDAPLEKNTWGLVALPSHRQAISCKCIFRVKENVDASKTKYKARMVAKGFHQVKGFDFHETFSPVVKLITVTVIFTLALSNGWKLFQLDASGDLLVFLKKQFI